MQIINGVKCSYLDDLTFDELYKTICWCDVVTFIFFNIVINDKKVPWCQHFKVNLETKKELSCVYDYGITFGFSVKVMS